VLKAIDYVQGESHHVAMQHGSAAA
jgi:hypothetical protein